MAEKKLFAQRDIASIHISSSRKLHSATHEEILSGLTTDIYWYRSYEILSKMGLLQTHVTMEVFARKPGLLCGMEEVLNVLKLENLSVWGLKEGESFLRKETVLRLEGPYGGFGHLETVILGILSSCSGWATAANECKKTAGKKQVICFGARHVHPSVAPVMERAALVGGMDGASCVLGARLAGREPRGTIPHAAVLIVGDTVKLAKVYNRYMPPDAPRIILIDTFKDEAEEAIRVAKALRKELFGVRLDTAEERGGVTPELVREVRARLDMEGFPHVKIFVSGGLTPDRIRILSDAGADAFGVGSYVSCAPPLEMTMDIREVEGKPVAKRGRTPGKTKNLRLKKLL